MEEYDHINDNSALLKELGLLNDGESLRKRKLADYTTLQFFDYEHCFAYFAKRIMNIRQAKIRGEIIVAKPVLLLALIDGISENVFVGNEFGLTEWLEERYLTLMQKYTRSSQFSNITGIENPFWHLATDGFWNLQYRIEPSNSSSPSKAWLKSHQEQTARVEFFDIRGISADCGQSIVGNIVSNRTGESDGLAIVNS